MDSSPSTTASDPLISAEDQVSASKIAKVSAQNAALLLQISTLRAKHEEVTAQLKNKDAAATVKRHIKLLHDYNEIRDVGTGLMGMIAETRGVRAKDIYAEFGVAGKD